MPPKIYYDDDTIRSYAKGIELAENVAIVIAARIAELLDDHTMEEAIKIVMEELRSGYYD